jgi:hypothetical protein
MKTLVFPDGLKLSGFRWSLMGWWYRSFAESGINGEQTNCLRFTNAAIRDAGIVLIDTTEGG